VFDRNVTPGDLIDPQTNKLSAKAFDIFNEWYDLYSNENGVMTPESTIRFIAGATNEMVSTEDSRIKILFSNFDSNKDGILERSEFITFYETACRGKLDTVYDNLSNHFIRKDLLRMSEVYEE
jgi:Ca2+-binding EF-hand superfamily protein